MPFSNAIINEDLVRDVLARKHDIEFSVHGLTHWQRVERNGLFIASHEGGDQQGVSRFSLFHDSQRVNDFEDPEHGARGASLAEEFYASGRLSITEEQMQLLQFACSHHTDTIHHDDITVCCCWDADRLDLTRIGVLPDPEMLNTLSAKQVAQTMDYCEIEAIKHPINQNSEQGAAPNH